MSTIAAKFSTASTQFKVGASAAALVAAATLTPAVAQATPSIAPVVAESTGAAFGAISDFTALSPELNYLGSSAAAITDFNPFAFIFTNFIQPIAGWFYNIGEWALNTFAMIFRVGPYATSSVG